MIAFKKIVTSKGDDYSAGCLLHYKNSKIIK